MTELLATVRELELVARRNVSSQLTGNYLTSVVGRGLEFHEARRYEQGEPVRRIDWRMTARLDEPHVRTFVEEREREIFVALDVSPSMHTGWQERTKLETAVEMAATLAVSAVEAGDRLGLVTFSDRVHELLRPRRGRARLYQVLRVLAAWTGREPEPCQVSDPRSAIHAVQQLRGRRLVVFLLSDFIDHDIPDDLRYVQARHDVSLLHVYDPLEYLSTTAVRLPVRSPEGDPGQTSLRPGETGTLEDMTRFLAAEAARHRLATGSISTRDPVGPALARFFNRRRRRR